jgi:hypothetical protein
MKRLSLVGRARSKASLTSSSSVHRPWSRLLPPRKEKPRIPAVTTSIHNTLEKVIDDNRAGEMHAGQFTGHEYTSHHLSSVHWSSLHAYMTYMTYSSTVLTSHYSKPLMITAKIFWTLHPTIRLRFGIS